MLSVEWQTQTDKYHISFNFGIWKEKDMKLQEELKREETVMGDRAGKMAE